MLLRFTLLLISDTTKLLLGAQTMCTLPLTLARWLVARRGSTTGFDSIPATMVSGTHCRASAVYGLVVTRTSAAALKQSFRKGS